jgi:hypothetical protein
MIERVETRHEIEMSGCKRDGFGRCGYVAHRVPLGSERAVFLC